MAIVILGGGSESQQGQLERLDFASRAAVIHVGSGACGGTVLDLEAPREWSVAARLIALANSGHLDRYRWLAVCSDVTDLADFPDAVLHALRNDPGLGLVVHKPSAMPTNREERRVNRLLRRMVPTLSVHAWRYPTTLGFLGRAFLVQGLRSLRIEPQEFQQRHGRRSDHVLAQLLGALTAEAGCRVAETGEVSLTSGARKNTEYRARIVPFYLPQFHPTPENDEWWGKGFTEWTNVTGAIPVYHGHQQPKLPTDLGFYDLRLDAVREEQAALAAEHGVAGFMYYHYWFAGRRVLHTPLQSLAEVPEINVPFCLMWANENWTRSWDGGSDRLLLAQEYASVPGAEFIAHVLDYMQDSRYLRVDGRPVIAVYRPGLIPDFSGVVEAWRHAAAEQSLDLYILAVAGLMEWDGVGVSEKTLKDLGLDGSMDFPPHSYAQVDLPRMKSRDPRFRGRLLAYGQLVASDERRLAEGIPENHYPTIMPAWDNTARRQWDARVWVGANPYTFRRWLDAAIEAVSSRDPQHRMVFVNAWNEWAEGAVLEPSVEHGRSFLQAIRDLM